MLGLEFEPLTAHEHVARLGRPRERRHPGAVSF